MVEAVLTAEEIAFLKTQKLSSADVFDARRLARDSARRQMRELGKTVMLGTACGEAGHRLRTRSGHCIQCDTSKLAYALRHRRIGHVYVAFSRSGSLVKIGSTSDTKKRERQLNAERYAGRGDWRIFISREVAEAGLVERELQSALAQFATKRRYEKDGQPQEATEIFECDRSLAVEVARRVFSAALETRATSHRS